MAKHRIGVLSDTHLHAPTDSFKRLAEACFADVSTIIHAGDLTGTAVLNVFAGKETHAVRGNMCDVSSCRSLPEYLILKIGGFSIAVTHGARYSCQNIEEALYNDFYPVDCIIYGHTHRAVCHTIGNVLFLNPGSFAATSRYGLPGTYGIMEIDETINAKIHQVPRL